MKIKLLFLFALLCTSAKAQQWESTDGPNMDPETFAICSLGSNLMTTASCGIFESTDQGNHYSPILREYSYRKKNAVYDGKLYLAGDFQTSMDQLSYANGEWEVNSTGEAASDIYAGNSLGIMIAGDGVKRSIDGLNWTEMNNGLPQFWYYYPTGPTSWDSTLVYESNAACYNENNRCFAATDSGIYRTDLFPIDWQPINNGLPSLPFQQVRCKGDTLVAVAGTDVYVSHNSGGSWFLSYQLQAGNTVNRVKFLNNYLFVLSEEEGVIMSSDYGQTWTYQNSGLSSLAVRDIEFSGGEYHLACGEGIMKNLGNWMSSDHGVVCCYAPNFAQSQNGIAAAAYADLFYLGDDSTHWVNTTEHLNIWQLRAVERVEDYLVVSLDGDVAYDSLISTYRSLDNGVTWNKVSELGPYGPYRMASNGTLLSAAFQDNVYVSNDIGLTWYQIQALPDPGNNCNSNSPVLFGEDYWFVSGCDDLGRISRSDNYGVTWSPAEVGLNWGRIQRMWEFGDMLFAGSNYSLYRSFNNGNTWNVCYVGGSSTWSTGDYFPRGMVEWNGNYFLSTSNSVYHSSDGGNTFSKINEGLPSSTSPSNEAGETLIERNDTLYFGTSNFGVYQLDLQTLSPFLSVDVEEQTPSLSIYPNPASDWIQIKPSVPLTNAHIKLFAMNGQLIRSEYIELLSETSLNLYDLNGPYIVEIISDDGVFKEKLVIVD